MRRMCLNMLDSSNGDRKRKAPEGGEMTHSPPPLNLQLRLGQPGAPPPRFPTPPPLNPQLHLDQPGASSSLAQRPYFEPHAPQALKYNNDAMSEMLEEMCKRQYAWERLKKLMEAMLANYRTQALTMAERVKALEKTNAALNVALHLEPTPPAAFNQGGGGGDGAGSDQVVVVRICCKTCWRGPATMMAWPCRHLCLCNNCAGATIRCPICPARVQHCIEVKFC